MQHCDLTSEYYWSRHGWMKAKHIIEPHDLCIRIVWLVSVVFNFVIFTLAKARIHYFYARDGLNVKIDWSVYLSGNRSKRMKTLISNRAETTGSHSFFPKKSWQLLNNNGKSRSSPSTDSMSWRGVANVKKPKKKPPKTPEIIFKNVDAWQNV